MTRGLVLRALVSVVVVVLLVLYLGGIGEIGAILASSVPAWVALGFAIITADRALMVFKWKILLRTHRVPLPFLTGMKIYCAATIWGLFLPTTLGADAIRAVLTTRGGYPGDRVLASIVVERTVGFLASLLVGLMGLGLLSYQDVLQEQLLPLWVAGTTVLFLGATLFAVSLSRALFDAIYRRLPGRLRTMRWVRRLASLHEAYVSYGASRRTLWVFLILSFFEQLFSIAFIWITAIALHVEVGLLFVAGVVPLAILISRVPISLDGIGVFEGMFAALMGLSGISAAASVSTAFLGRIIQIVAWAPWWAAYALGTGRLTPPDLDPGRGRVSDA